MGFIYIIKNTINSKVYIGQTTKTIETRYKAHVWNINKANTKLCVAMRELGSNYFYIEQLEECNDNLLDDREIYWIKQYDSYNNGYNSTPGGKFYSIKDISWMDDLISDYYSGISYKDMAIKYNVSLRYVQELLNISNAIHRETELNNHTNKSKELVMYDTNFDPIKVFRTINEAISWLLVNTDYRVNKYNGYTYITAACKKGNIAYGHRWQLTSDLTIENKVFRTKFEKEAYMKGCIAYKPKDKEYYIVDNVIEKLKGFTAIKCDGTIVNKHNNKDTNNTCIDCGKVISHRALRCVKCNNKYQHDKKSNGKIVAYCCDCGKPLYNKSEHNLCISCLNVRYRGKSRKLSKEELQTLLNNGVSTSEIADMCERNISTIIYWKNQYNIECKSYTKTTSKGVACRELNIQFKSFRAAAKYLIDNDYCQRSLDHLAHDISQAMKYNKTLYDMHWDAIQ